ncbi:MAG: hypothetical protein PWQ91_1749, partial [Eubacteriales bacterium]|nr:hypothetical protein [Eubacteriales bacterium]
HLQDAFVNPRERFSTSRENTLIALGLG